jgi:hypothetical protein
VSHLTERKQKDCLNCGAVVQGRFCQVCGQENIEPKESFWHLVTHFMYDITHFDGKFFSTLKYLLFKPGFLSHEYLRGRRASYLHPIRMYVFTSAFFFLIFFSFQKENSLIKINETKETIATPNTAAGVLKKLEKKKAALKKILQDSSMPVIAQLPVRAALELADSNIALIKRDSTKKNKIVELNEDSFDDFMVADGKDSTYKTIGAYDSAQKRLPASERDNFIVRRFQKQNIHLKEKYHGNNKEMIEAIIEKFKHLFPQMLFVSLPLFALLLQLLYVRRKNFFYVNHVVFTIHLYCGTFIILLAEMASGGLFSLFDMKQPGLVKALFVLAAFFFWYKSLRNFYEQRRTKTVLKYLLIMFLASIIMVILFSLFFLFSAMSI